MIRTHRVGLVCLVLAQAGACWAGSRAELILRVDAGAHARQPVIASVPWPMELDPEGRYQLRDKDEPGAEIAAQRLEGAAPRLVWLDPRPLAAHQSRTYRVESLSVVLPGFRVTCRDDGERLILSCGAMPVAEYYHATAEPPEGIDAIYRRSGFLHPLFSPERRVLTDDFPPDHAHQHGLFFAWVKATFRGQKIDFWNQAAGTGNVRHQAILDQQSGPVLGQFLVQLRHEAFAPDKHPVPVLDETWQVRAYAWSEGEFLVDFESRQMCVSEEPLEINQAIYGGLGLRGNRAWFDPQAPGNDPPDPARSGESDFLTSEGRTRADGNHTRPRWVDLSGRLEGAFAGIAILDHPANFRAPQPVRLHPNKPYLSYAPEVVGGFTIEPGQTYTSRYRLVLHDGPPDSALLERLWHDYAEPVEVRVED